MNTVLAWVVYCLIFLSTLGLIPFDMVGYTPHLAMAQDINLYFLPRYESKNEMAKMNPGESSASVTVMTFSNLTRAAQACLVKVEWRTMNGTTVCTTQATSPIIDQGFLNHCSRPFQTVTGNFPRCDATCLGGASTQRELVADEGPAVVSVTAGCETKVGMQALNYTTVYTPSPDGVATQEIILGAHNLTVLRIQPGGVDLE